MPKEPFSLSVCHFVNRRCLATKDEVVQQLNEIIATAMECSSCQPEVFNRHRAFVLTILIKIMVCVCVCVCVL